MSEFTAAVDNQILERRIDGVRNVALHKWLGLRIEDYVPGSARLVLPATPAIVNNVGVMHGGVMYAMLDVACYCAAAALWSADENAVSHDIHVQMLRPAGSSDVEIRSRILKRGRNIIFGESEGWSAGKLVARAAVTKSVISLQR